MIRRNSCELASGDAGQLLEQRVRDVDAIVGELAPAIPARAIKRHRHGIAASRRSSRSHRSRIGRYVVAKRLCRSQQIRAADQQIGSFCRR
jgi:hypothetical protein